jgi:hypothetical protein
MNRELSNRELLSAPFGDECCITIEEYFKNVARCNCRVIVKCEKCNLTINCYPDHTKKVIRNHYKTKRHINNGGSKDDIQVQTITIKIIAKKPEQKGHYIS